MIERQEPLTHQLIAARLKERFDLGNQSLSKVRVLDLGCGTGEQIVYMTRLGFQMSGCEIDRNSFESTLTALKAVDASAPDVRLSKAPTEVPFESDLFHAVYANGVFEHSAEMPALIAEIARVLIPNGIFITAFPLRSVIMEPHLRLPFVHWFPKGQRQRLLIRTMSHFFGLGWSLQGMERYLQNEVFYWTSGQARQIFHRHFEETNSLAKEYLVLAKNQVNRSPMVRLAMVATEAPLLSSILEHLVSWQWTYIVEANKPIKKQA
jgi:SAM-dependent methyltransferase